jgi:hypothetical protein
MYVYFSWAVSNAASSDNSSTEQILKNVFAYGVGGLVTIAVVVVVTILARRELKKAMNQVDENKPISQQEVTPEGP